jgi:hypothetical protein
MTIRWNPNFEDEVKREVVRNLTPQYRAALAKVTCPDHGAHPSIEASAESWEIHACCERGKGLALEAIRKVNDE